MTYNVYAQPRSDRDDSDLFEKVLMHVATNSIIANQALEIVKTHYQKNDVKVWVEEIQPPRFQSFESLSLSWSKKSE